MEVPCMIMPSSVYFWSEFGLGGPIIIPRDTLRDSTKEPHNLTASFSIDKKRPDQNLTANGHERDSDQ